VALSYQDVNQGNLGDCYLLASLAGTAYRTPSTIQNMFTDNGDGTFTVRFLRNGVANYVTVDRLLTNDCFWLFLLCQPGSGFAL
jgi:hypothetical protein